jgi:hypothetical protein
MVVGMKIYLVSGKKIAKNLKDAIIFRDVKQ